MQQVPQQTENENIPWGNPPVLYNQLEEDSVRSFHPIPVPPHLVNQPPLAEGYPFPSTPMQAVQNLDIAWISQKLRLACCHPENRYSVYKAKSNDGVKLKKDKNEKLFKCKEYSTCGQRSCCPPSAREFSMSICFNQIQFDLSTGKPVTNWVPFLNLRRDFKCTCCCKNRPEIVVEYVYSLPMYKIGYVTNPCVCCEYNFDIFHRSSIAPLYKVNADCCQCGFGCRCPCDKCKEVAFDILDYRKGTSKVGEIRKMWSGCAKENLARCDNYAVTFPLETNWEIKSLLLACGLFVDYLYFEDANNNNNNQQKIPKAPKLQITTN